MPEQAFDLVRARRALLRQQTELLGPQLPWLAVPARIPPHAVDASVGPQDVRLAAFSLAAWMLIELVQAAGRINHALDWGVVMDRHGVAPRQRESLSLAVLSPLSRHAPGLFAIAEILSVLPAVAERAQVPRAHWSALARRSEAFGAQLARDGTGVQVLVRSYLGRSEGGLRCLDPARLRIDAATGLATVTPIGDLLAAARDAARHYQGPAHGVCVALQAAAPGAGGASMFGAIWASFADAAARLVFPRFDPQACAIPPQAAPDPDCAQALERLAVQRHAEVARAAACPYPPAAERILANLLARTPSRAP